MISLGEKICKSLSKNQYSIIIIQLFKTEELHVLLTPNKKHKNVFPNVPVIGFRNGKTFTDYLVRAILPILNDSARYEPYGRKTCDL